jgi:hypothetical protein
MVMPSHPYFDFGLDGSSIEGACALDYLAAIHHSDQSAAHLALTRLMKTFQIFYDAKNLESPMEVGMLEDWVSGALLEPTFTHKYTPGQLKWLLPQIPPAPTEDVGMIEGLKYECRQSIERLKKAQIEPDTVLPDLADGPGVFDVLETARHIAEMSEEQIERVRNGPTRGASSTTTAWLATQIPGKPQATWLDRPRDLESAKERDTKRGRPPVLNHDLSLLFCGRGRSLLALEDRP